METSLTRDRWSWCMLGASTIVFVAVVLFGASGGIRGSDQYWYLDDTETLLRGDAPNSNCLYPRQLLVQGTQVSPIIHDILPQRAVVPLARVIDPYWSWITLGAAAMLLGAVLGFMAMRRVCDPIIAASAAAALLLLPLSVQCSTQVLAEPSMVPLFAAMLVLIGRPGGFGKYLALAIMLTLALMSRFTSIAFLPLLPLLAFTEQVPLSRRWALAAWSTLLLGVGAALNKLLFNGIPIPGNPIALNINGSGMGIWLTTEPIVVTLDSIKTKLASFVTSHAELSEAGVAMAAINGALMLTATLGAVALWRRSQRVMALFVWIVVAVNLATLTLYQNQIRFVLPTFPVLLLGTAVLAERLIGVRPRVRMAAALATLAILIPPAVILAWVARREGVREAQECDRLRVLAADLRGAGDLIHVGGNDQMLAHCVRPRTILFVTPDQAEADWKRILAMPRWRWVVGTPADLARLGALGVVVDPVSKSEHRGAPIEVVEIRGAGERAPAATLPAPSP